MAEASNTNVVGWDDWYTIVPHGKEWTVCPDGKWEQTGDTCRKYHGSWIEWLNGGCKKTPKKGDGKESKCDGKKGKGGKECGFKINLKGTGCIKDGEKK